MVPNFHHLKAFFELDDEMLTVGSYWEVGCGCGLAWLRAWREFIRHLVRAKVICADTEYYWAAATEPSKKVLARINEVLGWGLARQRSPGCYEEVITISAHTSALITIQRGPIPIIPLPPIQYNHWYGYCLADYYSQSLAMNSHCSHKTLFSCCTNDKQHF